MFIIVSTILFKLEIKIGTDLVWHVFSTFVTIEPVRKVNLFVKEDIQNDLRNGSRSK